MNRGKKFKLVYIEWEDALHPAGKWTWKKDVDGEGDELLQKMKHAAVGFVIKETKNFILLSQGYQLYRYSDGDASIQDPFLIPISAIRKRKTIKV